MLRNLSGIVLKSFCVGVAATAHGITVVQNDEENKCITHQVRPEVFEYLKNIHCSEPDVKTIIDKASIRLLNRLATDDEALPEEITFKSLWEASPLKTKYKHDNESCVLFWENYLELKDLLVVRMMSNDAMGSCHTQATVCTQHYVVAVNQFLLNNKTDNVGMITIPSLLRHKLNTCDLLRNYLFSEKGGKALQDLGLICDLPMTHDLSTLTPEPLFTPKEVFCNHVMDRLKRQPALVHRFAMIDRSGFAISNGKVSFSAADVHTDRSIYEELHAMVLVGMRRDDEGQYWFLMQNWWSEKLFVEVSYEFLMAADASITFVNKPIVDIPLIGCMERTYSKALLTELDKGDSWLEEK